MFFRQAAARCGLLFLAISWQTVPIRAGDPQPNIPAGQSAAPSDPAPSQTRSKPIDTTGLQSQALLAAIDKILKRAASERAALKTLPPRDKFLFDPVWMETREEREKTVRDLLDSALAIVTDAPILTLQDEIQKQREKIASNRERIAGLRERRPEAPQTGLMPGILTETQDSIDQSIETLTGDIKSREADIARVKAEIGKALAAAGVQLSQDQLDLLLDSVLGGDLLKLMTAFEVAKIADQRLGILVQQSNEDLKSARRYFAMHAALFAMLVQAQDFLIDRIDKVYLARLDEITANIERTSEGTRELLQSQSREDQRRALEIELERSGSISKSIHVLS